MAFVVVVPPEWHSAGSPQAVSYQLPAISSRSPTWHRPSSFVVCDASDSNHICMLAAKERGCGFVAGGNLRAENLRSAQ
jgi:hypothetical protein